MDKQNSKLSIIIAAAGSASRLNLKKSKLFLKLKNKELILHSLEKFLKLKDISEIIIVTNDIKNTKKLINKSKYKKNKIIKIIQGGETRQDSVFIGFSAIAGSHNIVIIHDVARPFFNIKDVEECIKIAQKKGCAILGTPAIDTLKEIRYSKDGIEVIKTLDRNKIFQIQTPQVFKYSTLAKAYKRINKIKKIFTDEASMVEYEGSKVYIVTGSRKNIKITFIEDIENIVYY